VALTTLALIKIDDLVNLTFKNNLNFQFFEKKIAKI